MKKEEIKNIRQSVGKTQKEFSAIVGVTIHAVRKWEQGQRTPGGSSIKIMQEIKKQATLDLRRQSDHFEALD